MAFAPTMFGAFKIILFLPFLRCIRPKVLGLKSLTYDSIRGNRSVSGWFSGGSCASLIVVFMVLEQ